MNVLFFVENKCVCNVIDRYFFFAFRLAQHTSTVNGTNFKLDNGIDNNQTKFTGKKKINDGNMF